MNTINISRPRDPVDAMVIEDLAQENAMLRAALADLGADYVLVKTALAKVIKQLSAANVRELRRRARVQALVDEARGLQEAA